VSVGHTLGPWKDGEDGTITGPQSDRGWPVIAEVTDHGDGEWIANARLIAAAPDLLRAGDAAVDILETYVEFLHRIPADELEMHPYIPAVEEAFDLVRDAITKARAKDGAA